MEIKGAKSVSPLGIILAIQVFLLALRLAASLLPDAGIAVHTHYIIFAVPKDMMIVALWCLWMPTLLISIILLYGQKKSRDS